MGKYQSRYKKAAKLQRTFNRILTKVIDDENIGEKMRELNRKRYEIHQNQRELLDTTLGAMVLREIYWEGKEL